MDAYFCSQICSFLDVLNNITDYLCGYQDYVNIAWMLIFFEIFLKKIFRFSRCSNNGEESKDEKLFYSVLEF